MMVPRAYMYASPTPTKHSEKDLRSVSRSPKSSSRVMGGKKEPGKAAKVPDVLSPPPSLPSQPVVIPTRTRHGEKRKMKRDDEPNRKASEKMSDPHDTSSMPSSVAALLAMTSIPERHSTSPRRSQNLSTPKEKIERRRMDTDARRAISSSSPQTWEHLLSPPDEDGFESCSFRTDSTLGPPLSSVRSPSTESMPSLVNDEDSINSSSNPTTPRILSTSRSDRKQKSLTASRAEDCILDHPLLPPPQILHETAKDDFPAQPPRPTHQKFSFKSNLTASIRVLRSAARSFSNFTTPTYQTDNLLSNAVLSIPPSATDDRRPLPTSTPPDPALRRYLNPITLSPADLHFHTYPSPKTCHASIQLQPYIPNPRRTSTATAPPIFPSKQPLPIPSQQPHAPLSAPADQVSSPPSLLPRQREPRENSDFLRIIVLEMNMRKQGKLSEKEFGRARLWLPARQVGGGAFVENGGHGEKALEGREGKVPRRWRGMRA